MEVIAEGLAFPEGPVVMADGAAIGPDGALWVSNNGGHETIRIQHASGPASKERIERVDLGTDKFERAYEACESIPLEAANDLVFDAERRLWLTDLKIHFNA